MQHELARQEDEGVRNVLNSMRNGLLLGPNFWAQRPVSGRQFRVASDAIDPVAGPVAHRFSRPGRPMRFEPLIRALHDPVGGIGTRDVEEVPDLVNIPKIPLTGRTRPRLRPATEIRDLVWSRSARATRFALRTHG